MAFSHLFDHFPSSPLLSICSELFRFLCYIAVLNLHIPSAWSQDRTGRWVLSLSLAEWDAYTRKEQPLSVF